MLTRRALLAAGLAMGASPILAAARRSSPWSAGTPLPFAVQEIYPTAWRGALVLAGGFRARGPGFVANLGALWPTAATIRLQPGAGAWDALTDMPGQLHHPFLAAPGVPAGRDPLLAIGGFSSGTGGIWTMERQCWMLDAPDGAWREGPALPLPQAEVAGGVIDGAVLLAGGRRPSGDANGAYGDHEDTGAAFILKPGSRQWEALAPLPVPRNSAAAAVLGGRLHVAGGRVVTPGGLVNRTDHHAYDPLTGRWQTLAPMPAARGGHAAAVLGGRLWCFGGESFGKDGRAHHEVFAYDPAADRWTREADLPQPVHGLGAVALNGAVHLLGGAAEVGGRATRRAHDIFRP
ncbi:Kelch repeat-containing protein [Sandaracinobacteroides sp. A072]|uniref:Kelch repeat-containing protein n=1 Tax=Sandaracinobacteroides sp. A072 TaxID=3461146 RepID=UPI00404225CA